MGVELGH